MKQNQPLRMVYALLCVALAVAVGAIHGPAFGFAAIVMLSSSFAFLSKVNPYALGAFEIDSQNTGDTLAAMDPDGVREIWQQGCDIFEQTADFWTPMEGGRDSVVETVTDTSKGVGQKISFSTRSGFYDEPHMGDELFLEKEDFEERLIDTDSLSVDFIRHATRSTVRMEEVMGMRGEIRSHDNEDLGDWMGRWKSEAMFMTALLKVPSDNVIYAGSKTLDTLTTDQVINWDEIVALGAQQKRLGGNPALMGKTVNGNPLYRNLFVATSDALLGLEADDNFKLALRHTVNESNAKMLFDGGYTDVRGHLIKEFQPIDHDGEGAIGSPLNPKAVLGVAVTAGTAAFDITGGGNSTSAAKTKKLYFKHFPGHAYRFSYNDTYSPASETRYCVIINPPNAETDPNKWGFYAYTTGNNGNKITITSRLGSTGGGTRNPVVGGVTWDSTKNTDVHPAGALVLPANRLGTVFGKSLMLGRRALRRGYGQFRNSRTQDIHNGGHVTDRFITTVVGQAPRKDRLGRVPGVFVLVHALPYAGIPLPDTGA